MLRVASSTIESIAVTRPLYKLNAVDAGPSPTVMRTARPIRTWPASCCGTPKFT